MRAALMAAVLALTLCQTTGRVSDPPSGRIYSADLADPWNRIFAALLSRTVRTTMTDEHPEAAPFIAQTPLGLGRTIRVSTRTFERVEEGDRAIEPLYPSFITSLGVNAALTEPRKSDMQQALREALADGRARTPLARALMQVDLWSAFDAVSAVQRNVHTPPALRTAAADLLPLLAQLIGRLALTDGEIDHLPRNYAPTAQGLPDLFATPGEWLEVEWGRFRVHDGQEGAQFRHAARVFIRPLPRPVDDAAFLRGLTNAPVIPPVTAAALIMQTLLIDRDMRVRPAPLIADVQVRTFGRDGHGTAFEEFELSRRMLLARPEDTGFVRFADAAPAYLPLAGNDYGFATPQRDNRGETVSVLGTLRSRCSVCHAIERPSLATFGVISPERLSPPVRLPQPNDTRASYVAAEKEKRPEFAHLLSLARSSGAR